MDPAIAYAHVERAFAPYRGRASLARDELDGILVHVTRDLTHLDADALNDRLHAWAARDAQRAVPGLTAYVSFRHARPATSDEAELGMQAEWVRLEPTMRLEASSPKMQARDLDAFLGLVPAFLDVVEAGGRPEGWRSWDEGNAE